jgi:hypothetical protein
MFSGGSLNREWPRGGASRAAAGSPFPFLAPLPHKGGRDEVARHDDGCEMLEGVAQRSCSPNQHLTQLMLNHTGGRLRPASSGHVRRSPSGKGALFLLRLPARPVAPDACDLGGGSAHVNVVDAWLVLRCPSSTLTDTEMGAFT